MLCRLGISRRFSHPAQHSSLRDVEAEHLQLPVNARCSPGRIFSNHAEDQLAQFPAYTSSARTLPMPREPRPIQFEPCAVPADDRLRLYEDQSPTPPGPKPSRHHPKQFVRGGKSRLRVPLFQDSKLLPKRQIFQQKVTTRTNRSKSQNEQELHQAQHETLVSKHHSCKVNQR